MPVHDNSLCSFNSNFAFRNLSFLQPVLYFSCFQQFAAVLRERTSRVKVWGQKSLRTHDKSTTGRNCLNECTRSLKCLYVSSAVINTGKDKLCFQPSSWKAFWPAAHIYSPYFSIIILGCISRQQQGRIFDLQHHNWTEVRTVQSNNKLGVLPQHHHSLLKGYSGLGSKLDELQETVSAEIWAQRLRYPGTNS